MDQDLNSSSFASSFLNIETFITFAVCSLAVYYFLFVKKNDDVTIKTFDINSLDNQAKLKTDKNGFVDKMIAKQRNVVVFYGSQTGTAEEFALRLAKESSQYNMKTLVVDPEEYDFDELDGLANIEKSFALFCVATYGEGDPTDNALGFYDWLKNCSANLTGINYAVFGLGNKTYEHFNQFGKYLDKRLAELGANRICEIGLGDDDSNIEEDFITWKEKLWASICDYFQIEKSSENISIRQYELITHNAIEQENIFTGEVSKLNSYKIQRPPFGLKNPYLATIIVNKELYKGERSCRHIEFCIKGSKMRYETGDHVAIYPQNDPELVEKIGKLLNINLETVITLKNIDENSSKKNPFPCPSTYKTILSYYVDINSIPRTHVLKELAAYALNENHKELLKLMSSSTEKGKATYFDWIIKNSRSIVHVLEDLPSISIPPDHLLELLPRLQARYYSISSSAKVHPESISITAVVIDYYTPCNKHMKGVATNYLKNKIPEETKDACTLKVPIFVRKSQMKLPSKHETPIIMIGPGTGLAPFRGFLQERHWARQQGKPVGDTILYYGCRRSDQNFLYEQELKEYLEKGTLTKMYTAFSRDQPNKIYVTHLLNQNKKEVWDIIGTRNGHIYICGDARTMARDVKNIILEVFIEEGKKTMKEAEEFLRHLEAQHRYSIDVWS